MNRLTYIRNLPGQRARSQAGFTLVELLIVVVVMAILAVASVPALQSLQGNTDFKSSVDKLANTLKVARNHAIANNTYVWVGIYEEDAGTGSPTQDPPPYAGRGKVTVCMVASVDGTKIYEDSASPAMLPPERVYPIARLLQMDNIHLKDVNGFEEGADSRVLAGRPDEPYAQDSSGEFRLSSTSDDRTPFPFEAYDYQFYKTVRFSPNGEVCVNGAAALPRLAEIGVVQTRGSEYNDATAQLAAIQFSGVGGNIQIYRQ